MDIKGLSNKYKITKQGTEPKSFKDIYSVASEVPLTSFDRNNHTHSVAAPNYIYTINFEESAKEVLNPANCLLSYEANQPKNLSSSLQINCPKDNAGNLSDIVSNLKTSLTTDKIFYEHTEGKLNKINSLVTHSGISDSLNFMVKSAEGLFGRKSYLHHLTSNGFEELEFTEACDIVANLTDSIV